MRRCCDGCHCKEASSSERDTAVREWTKQSVPPSGEKARLLVYAEMRCGGRTGGGHKEDGKASTERAKGLAQVCAGSMGESVSLGIPKRRG